MFQLIYQNIPVFQLSNFPMFQLFSNYFPIFQYFPNISIFHDDHFHGDFPWQTLEIRHGLSGGVAAGVPDPGAKAVELVFAALV